MYRGQHNDKGVFTEEAIRYLCSLIRRIDDLQDLIDDVNTVTNKTNSSFKIQEDLKDAKRELREYVNSMVSKRLRTEIVTRLPELADIEENVMYLVGIPKLDDKGDPTGDIDGYEQYMFINGEIRALGSTKITLTDYYTKQQVNTLHTEMKAELESGQVVIGSITAYAGTVIPDNYKLCDGSVLNVADYPVLFTKIGTIYGGDGVTTFRLPNLLGKVVTCLDANDTDLDTVGKTGGSKTVTLTTNQMPSHTHTFTGTAHSHSTNTTGSHSHSVSYYVTNKSGKDDMTVLSNGVENRSSWNGSTNSNGSHSHSITNTTAGGTNSKTGGGESHENMMPYMALNYIIRAK